MQKCSILILHNQLAVRHEPLCFQSENFLKKKKEKKKKEKKKKKKKKKGTTVMQDIILGDEMFSHCL